jgi:hypothetical protein
VYDRSLESGTLPGFNWTWWNKVEKVKKVKKVRKVRKCKACGDSGHNIRTCKHIQCLPCSTPNIGGDIPQQAPLRKARNPMPVNRGVQVTQVVDYNVYDEPWVWAPVKPVNRRLTLGTMERSARFTNAPTFETECDSPLVLP